MAYRGNFRGGAGFARPENALKRADELEAVGQKHSALQALHDIITSKKHRTWSKTYESIMFKHIDLCVEMKKRNYGKEALMQYRNMCQQVNINSLEEVIKYFLKKAGDRAEEAQQKAAAATIDMEDLDEDASPEDLMLSYVSAEKGKDRTDRELVTPWFRFLWETYRCVLDILRTNPKLEGLYTMTANRAFQFCLQYKRAAEFRRLCDILRQHLMHLTNRYRDQRESPVDSLQLHLETRFEQLKVACELELWAEAFRSVEDIQALILLAKKSPKQQLMATYYARLTQIFAVSENHLYHAYAWLKLFNFSKSYNKNLTPPDLQQMACSVMLATLSIVPYERTDAVQRQDENQAEQDKERILRMANILGFSVDSKKDYRNLLTRGGLLSSINSMHILGLVPPEIRAIYDLLTSDFAPLELCSRLSPLLDQLSAVSAATPMSAASPVKDVHLQQYIGSLRQVAILRLLKQLSEVYSEMNIPSFAALVPFFNFSEVEAVIMDGVKHRFLQVRIDHRNGTLHFGAQQLEGDRARSHLSVLARRLTKALVMTRPTPDPEKEARRAATVKRALEVTENDHKLAIARKLIIEKRKEEAEFAMVEAEKEAEVLRAKMARDAEVAEEKRRREEMLRREKDRIEKELEERDMEEARALLEAQKKKAGPGAKTKADGPLDKRTIMAEAMQERIKDQQEMERKLHKLAKQLDHLERARREEEIPYIEAAYTQRMAEDKQYHQEQQAAFSDTHRKTWEADVVEKQRLASMMEERAVFQAQIMGRRKAEFEALQRQREFALAERRAQRSIDRENARRKEFVRRARDAVSSRVEEMEEVAAAEEKAVRDKEAEEERARVAERIKLREVEIAEKAVAERAALGDRAPPAAAAAPAAARPAPSGGAYVAGPRRTAEAAPGASSAFGSDRRSGADDSRGGGGGGGGGGDRWGGGGSGGGGGGGSSGADRAPGAFSRTEREERPASSAFGAARTEGGGGKWERSTAPRDAAPPGPAPPRDAAPAAAPGKFVPSARTAPAADGAKPSGAYRPPGQGRN